MRYKLLILIVAIVLSGAYVSAAAQSQPNQSNAAGDIKSWCRPNKDPLYDRARVLKELAGILNDSIPEYPKFRGRGFYSDSEIGVGFFVVDLMNPLNKDMTFKDCVEFMNGHVYHVAPLTATYSLSHIVILEEGKLKVFRSINCPGRGDKLEDVINYVSAKLAGDKNREQVLDRVRNYRKFGLYGDLQHGSFICKQGAANRE
jgi:hypothetical protein